MVSFVSFFFFFFFLLSNLLKVNPSFFAYSFFYIAFLDLEVSLVIMASPMELVLHVFQNIQQPRQQLHVDVQTLDLASLLKELKLSTLVAQDPVGRPQIAPGAYYSPIVMDLIIWFVHNVHKMDMLVPVHITMERLRAGKLSL